MLAVYPYDHAAGVLKNYRPLPHTYVQLIALMALEDQPGHTATLRNLLSLNTNGRLGVGNGPNAQNVLHLVLELEQAAAAAYPGLYP